MLVWAPGTTQLFPTTVVVGAFMIRWRRGSWLKVLLPFVVLHGRRLLGFEWTAAAAAAVMRGW